MRRRGIKGTGSEGARNGERHVAGRCRRSWFRVPESGPRGTPCRGEFAFSKKPTTFCRGALAGGGLRSVMSHISRGEMRAPRSRAAEEGDRVRAVLSLTSTYFHLGGTEKTYAASSLVIVAVLLLRCCRLLSRAGSSDTELQRPDRLGIKDFRVHDPWILPRPDDEELLCTRLQARGSGEHRSGVVT